jgi:ATP-binding cassette subfamily D (ALD) protein 2
MPAVISKFLGDVERRSQNIEIFSKTLVSTAVLAYIVKLSYPHIKKKFSNSKENTNSNGKCNNNNDVSQKSYSRCNGKVKPKSKEEIDKDLKTKLISKKLKQPGLNLDFIFQLKKLVEIMIPKLVCKETGLLGVHTLCLVSRTFLSIYVAAMEGAIVKYIVRKDVSNFAWMLLKWFGIAIPATFINSMIRYLENKLALAFR